MIDELVEGDEGEVGPHDLDDGSHAEQSGPDRASQDRGLGDRHVEDSVAEPAVETFGDAEDATR
nr:hypothetical protein [Microbacterium sp. NIBRBAC000506063]